MGEWVAPSGPLLDSPSSLRACSRWCAPAVLGRQPERLLPRPRHGREVQL